MEEGECSSGYGKRCRRCGRSFAVGKSWVDHMRSCSKNYNPSSMTVNTKNSYSREVKRQETRLLSLDLMSSLCGGWGKKRKRSTDGTYGTSSGSSMEPGSKILLQIGDSFNETKIFVEKKPQQRSGSNKKFKDGAMKEETGNEYELFLEQIFNEKKTEPEYKIEVQESYLDKVGAMKEERGLDEKYRNKRCGVEFDDFRRLGGDWSFYKGKKKMEEEGNHVKSKAKKNSKAAYRCDLCDCDTSFLTRKALGAHKRVHNPWNAHPVRRFDLNRLPSES